MANVKKTVLVIDDEPDTCVYISSLLEDNGFATVIAKDGDDALRKVKESLPDLITLDITMPERSGVRFYRDMKENTQFKHIPIIMVTGIAKDFEKFISSRKKVPPPEGYVTKPIDQAKFLELAKGLIAL